MDNYKQNLIETEYGFIPQGWKVGKLEDIVDFSNGYAFNSSSLLDEEKPDCFKVFKMGHIIKGGGFNYNGTKSWIEKDKCKSLLKYVLKKGDLLMAMTDMKGNISLLGNTALMDSDNEYIVNQRVGLLRSNKNFGTDYPYLYLLTNEFNFLEYLRGRSNSGVQVNLTSQAIKEAVIVIAPEEININFNKITKPIFNKIFNNQNLIRKLTELKQLYLKKFFG